MVVASIMQQNIHHFDYSLMMQLPAIVSYAYNYLVDFDFRKLIPVAF